MSDLEAHYNAKYGHEATKTDRRFFAPTPVPSNRFEACVSGFPRFFKGGDVLEIGAGNGALARSLAAMGLEITRYVATEYSTNRLGGLQLSLQDPLFETLALDAENPPQGLGTFDAVIMIALIEHLVDPLRALARLREHLKPGGFIWIDTPNIAKYTRRLKLLAGRFPSTASTDEGLLTYEGERVDLYDEGHLHYFTFTSLERMLTSYCGFRTTARVPYFAAPRLPKTVGRTLAHRWPNLWSDVCLVAYA